MLKRTHKTLIGLLLVFLLSMPCMAFAALPELGDVRSTDMDDWAASITNAEWTGALDGWNNSSNVTGQFPTYHYSSTAKLAEFASSGACLQPKIVAGENAAMDATDKMIEMGYDTDGTASNFSYSAGIGTSSSQPTDSPKQQVWQIRVKLPEISSGQTYLFKYSQDNGYSGIPSGSAAVAAATSGILLKNGGIYVADESIYDGTAILNDYVSVIADGTMSANAWYTVIRVMDLSDTTNHKQRVMLYNAQGELLGSSNWSFAGKTTPTYQALLRGLAFYTKGYKSSVYFDDLAVYEAPTHGVTTAKAISGDEITDKAGAFLQTKTSYILSEKINFRNNAYHKYEAEINLPSKAANQAVYLFALGGKGWYPQAQHFLVAIEGGKVYASTASSDLGVSSADNLSSRTQTAIYAKDTSVQLELDTNRWYKVLAVGNITTKRFNIYVYDDAGTLVGSIENYVKENYIDTTMSSYTFSYIGVKGYTTSPLLYDNIHCLASDNSDYSNPSVEKTYNFDGSALGDFAFGASLIADGAYSAGSSASVSSYGDPKNYCYVVERVYDYVQAGLAKSRTPEDIELTFAQIMDESTVNEDNIKLYVNGQLSENYSVVYNSNENTATVSVGTLEYGASCSLVLTDGLADSLGFMLSEQIFAFSVIDDPLTVVSTSFTGDITKGSTLSGTVVLSNNSDEEREYVIVLVLYRNNQMVDIAAVPGTISANTATLSVPTEALAITDDGTTASLLIWDNWSAITPLHRATNLPAE